MQSQSNLRLPLTVRMAQAINRALTWGMADSVRQRFLSESLADWEAMAGEDKPLQIILRALRGIPAAVWMRLSDREVTSMPAGIALSLVGLGGIATGVQSSAYPAPFRAFVALTSMGLLLVGINFVRDPYRLVVRRYRLATLLVAAGFGGLALTLPTAAEWPYDGPVLENKIMDTAMQASFVVIAIGFALLLASAVIPQARRLITAAGVTVMLGTAVLGVTQISWAVTMSPIDLRVTAASATIGLAALSFVHVLPRLRRLDIVTRQTTRNRMDLLDSPDPRTGPQ